MVGRGKHLQPPILHASGTALRSRVCPQLGAEPLGTQHHCLALSHILIRHHGTSLLTVWRPFPHGNRPQLALLNKSSRAATKQPRKHSKEGKTKKLHSIFAFSQKCLPLQRLRQGEMVEWSITTVLKTVVPRGTGGSNPSLSADFQNLERLKR